MPKPLTPKQIAQRKRNKKHYEANKEMLKARRLKRYYENREYERKKQAEYHKKNKGQILLNRHIRRAQDLTVNHSLMVAEWEWIKGYWDYCCAYCGFEDWFNLQIDHVIPMSKGGVHSVGNVVPACVSCNTSKQAQDLGNWLASKGDKLVSLKRFYRKFNSMMDAYYEEMVNQGWGLINLDD